MIRTTSLVLCIMLFALLFISTASAELPSVNAMEQMEKRIDSLLNDMTLDEKIYQLFIVTPEMVAGVEKATKATKATQNGLAAMPIGGMIYFSVNIQNKVQITEMIANSQTYAMERHGIGLFIAVDEEGGSVARVAGKLKTNELDSMRTIGRRGDPNEAYSVGKTIAQYISPLGFNLNFAPVADVNIDGKNTEIGSRSFGDDPVLVADMAVQVMKGLAENGIMATLKHFPGHGSTDGNSHYGKSISTRTLSQMEQAELLPFVKGIAAGAECIMISHLTAVEIDNEYPASLSKTVVTGLLRDRLGYDGLVVTDALKMKAVSGSFSSAEASVLALEAGVDLLLMPASLKNAVNGIKEAVGEGRITEERINESLRRILYAKWKYGLITP